MTPHSARPRRLRDVADVDEYVQTAVESVAPGAAERHPALHEHGLRAIWRLERALPPGVPLLPVLDSVLPARLAALDIGLRDTDAPFAVAA